MASARRGRIMALTAAFLGWAFDGFEMGLFPLIGKPALQDLLGLSTAASPIVDRWFAVIIAVYLVGAATGGVLFGWLGDKLGRVKAMSLSILTYALFTGFCGFVTEAWQITALRFIASLGMGGEWSLGVALVNELWPGKSRAWTAGVIGAAANVGFLGVALFSLGMLNSMAFLQNLCLSVGLPDSLVQSLFQNGGWRFLMISGAFPALLIFYIRMYVPESGRWEEERAHGSTAHWAAADLKGVLAGAIAALTVIWAWSPLGVSATWAIVITIVGMAIVVWGYLYPVRRYLQRAIKAKALAANQEGIVITRMVQGALLAGVALLGTWGVMHWSASWAYDLTKGDASLHAKEWTQISTSIGAMVVTFFTPIVSEYLGRRLTYMLLCIGALGSALCFYLLHDSFGTSFLIWACISGGMNTSFYGLFPLYFPELFPTSVRATGQGFSYNIGRIIAAIGGLQTGTIKAAFDNDFAQAGAMLSSVYLLGMILIWFCPETKGKQLE